jgi:hypothetical protein
MYDKAFHRKIIIIDDNARWTKDERMGLKRFRIRKMKTFSPLGINEKM